MSFLCGSSLFTFEQLQKGFSILLILLMAQAQFLSMFFVAFKSIAPETFIGQFCENTDKPELKCDGKCFLKKQEDAKSSFEHENTIEIISFSIVAIFGIDIISLKEPEPFTLDEVNQKQNFQLKSLAPFIFHPPRLV